MMSADAHTLTGAYALDALTGPERERFEQHLSQCEPCALEVDEFREVSGRLGAAVDSRPGDGLRARVLTAVTETRQLPPLVTTPLPLARSTPSWRTRAAAGLAAAAVITGVVVAGVTINAAPPEPVSTAQQQNPVEQAADAITVTGHGTTGGTATVAVSRMLGKVSVAVHGLPALDGAHAYQVWLIGPRGPLSAGLLRPGAGPTALIAAVPADANRMAITTEPVAGSPQPTTPGVALLSLG
ncbi:anti-sigma factor [Amycolatopsis saalfeldensis]|uniref:Regulator of SigK n=1 Tax=Amycolatopsis saalfeldensis TaxID=394193 RepID=A0A1H8YMD8_9PSEU|nr:anti-sigma factor [Amycolatopsis saalfeldensis]SEP53161.1 Anti-sigma-K factor RskA [Amycolatopsis saalfeldensis]